MKKIISIFLAIILSLSLAACGSNAVKEVETAIDKIADASPSEKAAAVAAAEEAYNNLSDKQKESVKNNDVLKKALIFVLASKAYNDVEEAYAITENFGFDIYEAWRMGIHDKDEIKKDGVKYLAKELKLSESDLQDGAAAYVYEALSDENWSDASEEDKDKYRGMTTYYITIFEDDLFSFCVNIVSSAYKVNGEAEIVQTALDSAKIEMREMSEKYSDYEHYSNLKSYYTTTNAFFEFCQNPTGSFNQVVDTINNYRNDARSYRNDLAYIFSD